MAIARMYTIGTSTTLESNKSLVRLFGRRGGSAVGQVCVTDCN